MLWCHFILFCFLNFIQVYLFLAALGLCCGMRDLLLWPASFSLVVARRFQSAWAL